MNKKNYLALDAIRFSLRMFRKYCYSLLKLSVVAGLLLWGMTALIYTIQHGFVTHDDLRVVLATLHEVMSGGSLGLVDLKSGVFIAVLIAFFVGISNMVGSKIAVMLYDDKEISFKEVISCFRRIPSYLGLTFLCSRGVEVASRLFIIFGFLAEVLFKLCKYFVVDKNVGINQALRGVDILKGHILDMCMASIITQFFMVALVMLSNMLCALTMSNTVAFMIACYTTFTCLFIDSCVYAFFYRKLLEEKEMKLVPAHVIHEDYNQIPKSAQETLQQ